MPMQFSKANHLQLLNNEKAFGGWNSGQSPILEASGGWSTRQSVFPEQESSSDK